MLLRAASRLEFQLEPRNDWLTRRLAHIMISGESESRADLGGIWLTRRLAHIMSTGATMGALPRPWCPVRLASSFELAERRVAKACRQSGSTASRTCA